MSTTDDTAPAAETDIAESAPLSEVLSGDRHDRIRQVGEEETAAPAAAPAAAAPAPVAETPAPELAARPEKEQPFWYRKEIEKERKARQAAEQRATQLEQSRPAPQPQGERPVPESPEQLQGWVEQRFERQRLIDRLERSEDRFIDKLGDEAFENTREWLATRPDIEEWALKQRDPWKAAHSQFTKEKLAAEIGEDPNAWREAERERLRQEILAEQQEERPAPAPATMRSAPPAPASTARAAAPRDNSGRFAGPAPLGAVFKHKG